MKQISGYIRKNGTVGFRNHILILASVVCANHAVQLLGQKFKDAIPITHQHGCSQGGDDAKQTFRTLIGIASNPNVAAVLVIGLGCELIKAADIAKEVEKSGKLVSFLVIQQCGGVSKVVEQGEKILLKMFKEASKYKRKLVGINNIVLGTECGGSDAFSGITANPALGITSNLIIQNGGTVILAETPELIGAESVLKKRCTDEKVGEKLISVIKRFEQRALDVGTNEGIVSPGNIKGGITTLEEKSLGCTYKGGDSEIKEVIDYANKPTKRGLVVMDTPGDDVEQISGMSAGGAQIIVFTTGRGTPVGCAVAPVIKISTNSTTYKNMKEHIDINAGKIIDGISNVEEMGQEIFDFILKVAEGYPTKSEKCGQKDFSINRIGPSF